MAYPWRFGNSGGLILIITTAWVLRSVNCEDPHLDAAPPASVPPVPVASPFGGFGGGGIWPGFGKGFHKSVDISAGLGSPFGGFGGPSPAIGLGPEGIPPPDADTAFGGPGFPPFGLVGPSYIPKSWLGSALGAKGDLLFPIVLFVFFVVGVWTVIQFLLALIVPLIAKKLTVGEFVKESIHHKRALTPGELRQQNIDNITKVVLSSISPDNVGCMRNMACQMGNSAFRQTKGSKQQNKLLEQLEHVKASDPETHAAFEAAALTGIEDCQKKYPCSRDKENEGDFNTHLNSTGGIFDRQPASRFSRYTVLE